MKVGDRVRNRGLSLSVNNGKYGVITSITSYGDLKIKYDDGNEGVGAEMYYELIKESIIKTTIMKVTNLVKRLLDADTQTLVEAGYINGDLQLTDEGTSELLSLVFMDKKADLVKLAQDKIAAAKK